jgi:F-type H+-transporting ATPase subunit a
MLRMIILGACSSVLYAGGKGPDFYQSFANFVSIPTRYVPAFSAVLSVPVFLLLGRLYSQRVTQTIESGDLAPASRFSVFSFLEAALGLVFGLAKDNCGHAYKRFFPLLSTLFFSVLFSNLTGLVPGLPPSTGNFSMNLSLGLLAFFAYNWAGVREHGLAYTKQFMGPFLALAPLFIVIEVISHCSRPLSLAFRLTGNIFGDHLLLDIFSGVIPYVFPVLLIFFGLLVACVQSFVFTLLTAVYISMAVSHDH